jgi:hypothetical protein
LKKEDRKNIFKIPYFEFHGRQLVIIILYPIPNNPINRSFILINGLLEIQKTCSSTKPYSIHHSKILIVKVQVIYQDEI